MTFRVEYGTPLDTSLGEREKLANTLKGRPRLPEKMEPSLLAKRCTEFWNNNEERW